MRPPIELDLPRRVPAEPVVAAPEARRQDIEALRVVCAFGIVWYHASGGASDVAYAALVVFLILSVYLGGRRSGTDADTIARRARRLLIPWALWWLVYAAFNLARGRPPIPLDYGLVAGVLAGPSIHLWYMPFVFMGLLAHDLARARLGERRLALGCGVLAVAVLASAPAWRPVSMLVGYPLGQWMNGAAALLVGGFLLHAPRLPGIAVAMLAAALALAALADVPMHGVGVPYALGIAAVGLVYLRAGGREWPLRFDALSQITMGIYFVHVLVLAVLTKLGLHHPVALPVLAFLVSAVLVAGLRRVAPALAGRMA